MTTQIIPLELEEKEREAKVMQSRYFDDKKGGIENEGEGEDNAPSGFIVNAHGNYSCGGEAKRMMPRALTTVNGDPYPMN